MLSTSFTLLCSRAGMSQCPSNDSLSTPLSPASRKPTPAEPLNWKEERKQRELVSVWLTLFNAELSPKRYWRGPRSQEVGGRGRLYLSLHCHHQNDPCIKMGSDESRFNVSLIVRDNVTRKGPQTTTYEERGEWKRNRTEILLFTRLTPYR